MLIESMDFWLVNSQDILTKIYPLYPDVFGFKIITSNHNQAGLAILAKPPAMVSVADYNGIWLAMSTKCMVCSFKGKRKLF